MAMVRRATRASGATAPPTKPDPGHRRDIDSVGNPLIWVGACMHCTSTTIAIDPASGVMSAAPSTHPADSDPSTHPPGFSYRFYPYHQPVAQLGHPSTPASPREAPEHTDRHGAQHDQQQQQQQREQTQEPEPERGQGEPQATIESGDQSSTAAATTTAMASHYAYERERLCVPSSVSRAMAGRSLGGLDRCMYARFGSIYACM